MPNYTGAQKKKSYYKKRTYKSAVMPRVPKQALIGKGDLKTIISSISKGVNRVIGQPTGPIGKVGSALGSAFGMPSLGRMAGNALGWLFGTGDYSQHVNNMHALKHNSLFEGNGQQIPEFNHNGRSTRVVHREYIGDLTSGTGSPTAFEIFGSYNINPGLSATFPWLSQIAANYETYVMNGLCFEFRSMSGSATGANTALGNVVLSAQYNANNPAFTSKQQMENYEGAMSVKPSDSLLFGIECDRNDLPNKHLYIRTGATTDSIQLYDMADLYIATQAIPTASQVLGELWVSYDVSLFQPKLFNSASFAVQQASFYSSTPNAITSVGHWFDGMVPNDENNLDILLTSNDGSNNGVITFPSDVTSGVYQIQYYVLGTATSSVIIQAPTLTNCQAYKSLGTPTTGYYYVPSAGLNSTPAIMYNLFVKITGSSATIRLPTSSTVIPASVTVCNLIVNQLNSAILAWV